MTIATRPAGKTRLRLSTIGLGTATLGGNTGSPIPETEARGMVSDALDAGISYVDVAPFYGYGKSERIVGDVLRERTGWVLSSKVGRLLKPRVTPKDPKDQWFDPLPFQETPDYSYDGVMRSFEDSLQRLGLDHIDILYMHDIGAMTHGEAGNAKLFPIAMEGGYKALDQLRASGAIQAIGLGVNEWQVMAEALKFGQWDVMLLAGRYTLLEQEPLHTLFPQCANAGTTIVVGGPFNSGVLAGRDSWNYSRAPQSVLDRVRKIADICDAHSVPLAAAALQFPLAHPIVSSVIPGPRSRAELKQILDWWDLKIPASLWTDLRAAKLIDEEAPIPI